MIVVRSEFELKNELLKNYLGIQNDFKIYKNRLYFTKTIKQWTFNIRNISNTKYS